MELYHTSPNKITEITNDGLYGSFLFFSGSEYTITAVEDYYTYMIDNENLDTLPASSIFYHEDAEKVDHIVKEVMNRFDVDEDTAENLLDESENIITMDITRHNVEPEDLSESAWEIQYYTALAATELGYAGAEVTDEQGLSYMIDMMGREDMLMAA